MKIVAKVERKAKDLLVVGGIVFGVLLIAALILAGIAWEILKVVAVIKFIAWW